MSLVNDNVLDEIKRDLKENYPELYLDAFLNIEARELIKINVLQNCADDPNELAQIVAERTHSQVVQVIGKKIVLYKESKNKKKIELPPANKKN